MGNSSYAQVEAAYVKEQLSISQKLSESRQRWIAAIIIAALVVSFLIASLIVKIRRRSQQMMQLLRVENNLQIAEMENKNSLALFEEQQRLGMELHDTIAGDLLGIKMFLELQVKASVPPSQLLEKLEGLVFDAYANTRKLSHDWYNGVAENIEVGFLEKLNRVIERLAPKERYQTEIYVDQVVFSIIPGGFRVQILHIIQEALYNIVKHAKATRISIRLVREGDIVMLTVTDNGVGFNVTKLKKGVGMESMLDRTKKMLGTMEMHSGEKGTTLKFIL